MAGISIILKIFKKHEVLLLFFIIYFIYNMNVRPIASGDTIPASLLPFSILENHNIYLDNFYSYWTNAHYITYFVAQAKGHYLSAYPIATPVLVTPLYVLPYLLLKLCHYPIDMSNPGFNLIVSIMEKLTASFIATIAGIFVFLSLKELIDRKIAFIGTMVFAFATNTWTISSQALWQHGLVELLLAVSIYIVLLNEKRQSDINIIYLGILSGLFVFNRPVESVLLVPILYYILNLRDRRIAYYFASMALFGGPFLLYNFYYFGSLFGGYNSLLSMFSVNSDNLISLTGLLISPNRGLFVYTPILILSFFGYLKLLQIENKNIRNFLLIFGLSISIQILIYSSFKIWWAGWSYGPRFLTGVLPALAIFLSLQIKHYFDQRIQDKAAFFVLCLVGVLLTWSIFVQFIGAFYYPNGNWDGTPQSVDQYPERLWNWNDTQIGRSFNEGIIPLHNPLKGLLFIGDLRSGGRNVAFRANGQYVCAEEGGGRELVANRDSLGPWETFILMDLGDNLVAFCAHSGQYVSVERDRNVVAKSNSVGPRETFDLIDLGNDTFALHAYNGRYVSIGGAGNELTANSSSAGPNETFKFIWL